MQNFIIVSLIGFVLSLVLILVIMPFYINFLKKLGYNQSVSEYALDEYKEKAKTPIMGGLLFVLIPLIVILVTNFSITKDPKAMMIIWSYISFCFVGFLDDFLIIIMKDNKGLSPKLKMLMQLIFATIIFFVFRDAISDTIIIPIINIELPLGIFYGLFMVFMYAAESNAVNFTDGMDGLCAGVSSIALIPFIIFALLHQQYDIAFIIIVIIGGLLGYLKYNFFPAKIFMGDSGSLALGALFASLAVALDVEVLLLIVGGVFLWEMLCVCIQQIAVRIFHRRVFKYTPIHYAFVLRGLKEKKVVVLFYMIQVICSIIGLVIGVI